VQDLQNSDVAIIGAPFDTGASFRAGARFGPEGIRSASHLLRPYNPSLDISIFEHLSVVDIGTISITVEPWMPVDAVARLYQEARRRMLGKNLGGWVANLSRWSSSWRFWVRV
jgi:arginase family enzyme